MMGEGSVDMRLFPPGHWPGTAPFDCIVFFALRSWHTAHLAAPEPWCRWNTISSWRHGCAQPVCETGCWGVEMDGCTQDAALCVRGWCCGGDNIRRVLSLSVGRRIPSVRYVIVRGCADGGGRVMSRLDGVMCCPKGALKPRATPRLGPLLKANFLDRARGTGFNIKVQRSRRHRHSASFSKQRLKESGTNAKA